MPIEIEEMTDLTISTPQDWTLGSSWIEGVNMFMGKMNVFIEGYTDKENLRHHTANFFLGSCNRPDMAWKLVLEVYEPGNKVPKYLEYHFATSI